MKEKLAKKKIALKLRRGLKVKEHNSYCLSVRHTLNSEED